MLFDDENEDLRHAYHKAPVLLQVVCQMLETHLSQYGVQLVLVDCEKHAGMWLAAVTVDSLIDYDALVHALELVNQQFQRTDDVVTCLLENDEIGLVSVRVTDTQDLHLVN